METYLPHLKFREDAAILAIEILALLLKNSRIKAYGTKNGIDHLFNIYADDLTIYLQRHPHNEKRNFDNVGRALDIIKLFFTWSGLRINRGKTYLSIFGKIISCPGYVNTLRIKWCTEFKLLGINFDQSLDLMDRNYDNYYEKVENELSSW